MNFSSLNHMRRYSALAIFIICSCSFGGEGQSEFVILANKDSPLRAIGKSELARLYLSKTKKVGGHAYQVVNLSEERIKNKFLFELTSMSEVEIDRHYITLELRGEGEKPKEVPSSKGMVFLLVKSDKIIGWLPQSEYDRLSVSIKKYLRVISITR